MDEKIFTRNRLRLPKISPKNFQNRMSPEKRRKRIRFMQVIAVIIIAFTFAYFIVQAIKPIMEEQCKTMAKSIATKISNNEATEVMKRYKYEDLLTITKDEQGNVKMVGTNVITVNEIISDVPVHIQEEFEKSDNNNFNIRLGNFLGTKLLSGRGPNVNIKMEIAGNLDTDLRSEFKEAGINQTLHRIYLEVKCNVIILTPFETMQEQIVNQVLLAEGVIVGEVPSAYYNLEGISTDHFTDVIK